MRVFAGKPDAVAGDESSSTAVCRAPHLGFEDLLLALALLEGSIVAALTFLIFSRYTILFPPAAVFRASFS